jgi:hypothetical protein
MGSSHGTARERETCSGPELSAFVCAIRAIAVLAVVAAQMPTQIPGRMPAQMPARRSVNRKLAKPYLNAANPTVLPPGSRT